MSTKRIEITKNDIHFFVTAFCTKPDGTAYQKNLSILKSRAKTCKFIANIKHVEQSNIHWKPCAEMVLNFAN